MTSRLRLTFFWLLALALTLQGASAASAHCVAGGGAGMASHAGMAMSGAMAIADPGTPDDMAAEHPASTVAEHKTSSHSSLATCGACSPCCIAAAPPAGRLDVVPVDVTHATGSTVAIQTSSFLTEGQDRPPRSLRA